MFLISNTIRATIYARRTEIQIMRLVGATKAYIRWPFFLEGGMIGLIGSIIPIGLVWSEHTYGCIKVVQISSLVQALAYSIQIHS